MFIDALVHVHGPRRNTRRVHQSFVKINSPLDEVQPPFAFRAPALMARTVTALLAVLSTLNFVLAQGYGRFPCSVNDKNGHMIPDQSLCSHDKLVAPVSSVSI